MCVVKGTVLLGSDASADQNITVHPPHRYAGSRGCAGYPYTLGT